MASRNRVKQKLGNREVAYGVWLSWLNPELVEFYGHLGFDYVVIDGEHLALDRASCLALLRACELTRMTTIVRVPENRPSIILGYLDIGVQGIYVPHVTSDDDARAIVDAVKYSPEGNRGAAIARSAFGKPTSPADYFRQANEDTMIVALVEDVEGIRNLDAILSVEGIDVVGVGDNDLSHSMGYTGAKAHPDVRKVVDEAEARIRSVRVLDAVVSSASEAQAAARLGALMVSLSDGLAVDREFRQYLDDVRA
jgi:2-keto-3-deoxy-L-rhamnonate aldolase RhmA